MAKQPSLTDTVVKVRAYLTDRLFGYEHWEGKQFSAPADARPALLFIFDNEQEREAALLAGERRAPEEPARWKEPNYWGAPEPPYDGWSCSCECGSKGNHFERLYRAAERTIATLTQPASPPAPPEPAAPVAVDIDSPDAQTVPRSLVPIPAPPVAGAQEPTVVDEVMAERARQDAKWGGPTHDDTHSWFDWRRFISQRLVGRAYPGGRADERRDLIQIAALAIAAVESFDRQHGKAASRPAAPATSEQAPETT